MDFEEMDEKMIDEDEETQPIESWQQQSIIRSGSSCLRRGSNSSSGKTVVSKRQAKSRLPNSLATLQNPYLKKSFPCEVELSPNDSWRDGLISSNRKPLYINQLIN